jgi:hypothetical protein
VLANNATNNGSIIFRFSYAGERHTLNSTPGSIYSDKLAIAKTEEIAQIIQQFTFRKLFNKVDNISDKHNPETVV